MACNCKFRKRIIESDFFFDPKKTIYLDYNATTPVDFRVLGAYEYACRNFWGNPSSLHVAGISAWEKLDSFRQTISEYFKCTKDGIHFCSSGSEAIHAVIWGILIRNKKLQLLTTNIEHSAILKPLKYLKFLNKKALILKVNENGKIDLNELENKLKNSPSLVAISPVNHETGGIQNVKEIYDIVKNNNSFLFLDGAQTAGKMSPDNWIPYCDSFCVSSHKIYAPKGSAFFWIKEGLRISNFRVGGNQEDGLIPGTENIPGIASLASAIDLLKKEFNEEHNRIKILTSEGLTILKNEFPELILESPANHASGILLISIPWIENMEEFFYDLTKNNICLSRFSACSGKVNGPSNILLAMNRNIDRASKSLRISFGRWSKREDFYYLVNILKKIKKSL